MTIGEHYVVASLGIVRITKVEDTGSWILWAGGSTFVSSDSLEPLIDNSDPKWLLERAFEVANRIYTLFINEFGIAWKQDKEYMVRAIAENHVWYNRTEKDLLIAVLQQYAE